MSQPQPRFSVRARIRSVSYALRGCRLILQTQPNAWIHLIATSCVGAAGLLLGVSRIEWCVLILAVMFVWITETLNTAIEFFTDLVSPEYHPTAGQVKDIAAAAVLISAVGSVLIGAIILVPRVIQML